MYPIPEFEGSFCELLPEFILYKRSLGYDYGKAMVYRLVEMNHFFRTKNISEIRIPEEVYLKWIAVRDHESTSNQQKRYCAIHGFALFLRSHGYTDVYDTDNPVLKKTSFTPYLFTAEEIMRILFCADHFSYIRSNTVYDNGRMMPVLLRLLYSTGFRISEALGLRLRDIDITEGHITVIDGKNHSGRAVVISDSMKHVLNNYLQRISILDLDAYIFQGKGGRQYSVSAARYAFHHILKKAGIPKRPSGHYPRLHDFRHLFAVRALEQMAEKGYDLYTSLPLLCKYLGHKSILETEYYLRLTQSHYAVITSAAVSYTPNLFPRVEVNRDE
jgi:integrase